MEASVTELATYEFEMNRKTFSHLRDINHTVLPPLATESASSSALSFALGLMRSAWVPTDQAEGTFQVTSRVFHPAETDVMRSVPTFQLQFVPVQQSSVLEFPQNLAEANERQDSSPSRPGCMRGIQSALAIEAVTALMFYGLWQLSHLFR
jgi:hypothetical protein